MKFDPKYGKRVQEAVATRAKNPSVKISQISKQFKVSYHQIRRRLNGVAPTSSRWGNNAKLSIEQDLALQDYLKFLISIGWQATKKHILIAGREIFKGGEDGLSTLPPRWVGRWFKRHRTIFKTVRGKTLSYERRASHERKQIELQFQEFQNAITGFNFCPSDVYNMDETGFWIGCLQGRIVLALAN